MNNLYYYKLIDLFNDTNWNNYLVFLLFRAK